MVFRQIGTPCPALVRRHLTAVRSPNDARKIACQAHCFRAGKSINLNLEVLRHELADDDCFVEQSSSHHALAEVGRKCFGACYHAHRIITWHFHLRRCGALPLARPPSHRQGKRPFRSVGGRRSEAGRANCSLSSSRLHQSVQWCRPSRDHEVKSVLALSSRSQTSGSTLRALPASTSESLAQRDGRLNRGEPLFRQMSPSASC